MSRTLDSQVASALAERVRFYRELGIYDFYRRPTSGILEVAPEPQPEQREEMPRTRAVAVAAPIAQENVSAIPKPEAADPVKALKMIREDIGDCTRCPLHKQGR